LRTVRSFNIEKGPGSVIASCLIKCNDNLLFVGSRLGNSVLLKYKENTSSAAISMSTNAHTVNDGSDEEESPANENQKDPTDESGNHLELNYLDANDRLVEKPSNLEPNENQMFAAGSVNANENEDQMVVANDYDELDQILDRNEEKSVTNNIVSHSFEICDILLNIAPCGYSIVGESSGDYSEFDSSLKSLNHHIDLVTSSGYTKNGGISVLQRSVRPEVIATFQINDVIDMWSVFNATTTDESSMPITYLFLSKVV
jgi:cleavage and polyadenylation specificity factor subunit 1